MEIEFSYYVYVVQNRNWKFFLQTSHDYRKHLTNLLSTDTKIWISSLMCTMYVYINLRMCLCKACVSSILTYGSETWHHHTATTVVSALNDENTRIISIATVNSPDDETSPKSRAFNMVNWVRTYRLQWISDTYYDSGQPYIYNLPFWILS